jgi:hypothetical protein
VIPTKLAFYSLLYIERELITMSQEKVDRRKEYKKNRKEILAREKRNNAIGKFIAYLCLLVILVGVGFSVYKKVNPTPEPDATAFYSLTESDSYGILTPSLPEE